MDTRFGVTSPRVVSAVLTVAVLWTASPCGAQAPRTFEVRPSIGSTYFLSEVGESDSSGRASLESTVGYGFDLGFPLWFSARWGLDVNLRYTPTEISVRVRTQLEGRTVEQAAGFDANLYAAGLSITRYFGRGAGQPVTPFVSAGGGVKQYTGVFSSIQYDAMWNVGGGVILESDLVRFRISLRDFMSVFDGATPEPERLQHDLMLSTAIVITPF